MNYSQNYDSWKTLPDMFFSKADELVDKPLFWGKSNDGWKSITWSESRSDISALATGLISIGVKPGDRVVLISENRPEWPIADLAIMSAGAFTVPAYTTNTIDDNIHILNDSGAEVVIVSSQKLAQNVIPAANEVDNVKTIISMEELKEEKLTLDIIDWFDLIKSGSKLSNDIANVVKNISRSDTACIIYTSGTGGKPKGVMLSHGAILSNCFGAHHLFQESNLLDLNAEVFLSFLPLSHSYEHTAGLYMPISIGAEIYYAESIDRLSANMLEVHPTMMAAVPRLYENMYQRIVSGVERKGGLSAKLFNKTIALGIKEYEQGSNKLNFYEKIQNQILSKLVRAKVAARFGGKLKAFISGGAPLNYDIGIFFHSLGVRLAQGYGMTETAPIVSCNPLDLNGIKIDTVGPPVPRVEVKLAPDNELLVRGELIMNGYWNLKELTDEILKDGWIHTGDIAEIDNDGYIKITDRKKDIIVNSGGDNISPQRVENALNFASEISQSMVYGDKRSHLVAVIYPSEEFLSTFKENDNLEPNLESIKNLDSFQQKLKKAVDKVNTNLSQIEQIRRFIIANESFTIDNGLMTPTLKPRRHQITKIYGDRLDDLYGRSKKD
ncbi:MAG: long-chain fatty acid--CoA ligase [Rhodospirillaceae bacterium]|nr:long-chain fatty acid--CoA ligase [Rhodospirillaceae bacterium]|tara:strand:- start:526 stop:2355 length:1830 start_codon:yes stop_codon:yes gene_type:complete